MAKLNELKEQIAAFLGYFIDENTLYFTSEKSGDWQLWTYNFQNENIESDIIMLNL